MDSILPLTNDKLRKRLFLEAEKAVRMDGTENVVPIMRLARILMFSVVRCLSESGSVIIKVFLRIRLGSKVFLRIRLGRKE